MPTKKIILTGRFATPADIEAQIAREERGATFEVITSKEQAATIEDLLKIRLGDARTDHGKFQSAKAKNQAKKKFFFRRKKKSKGLAKKESQTVTPDTLKPYVG
jgi:hypothetical protein